MTDIKVGISKTSPPRQECDALVIFTPEKEFGLYDAFQKIDKQTKGALSTLLKEEQFRGKPGEVLSYHAAKGMRAGRLIISGLGKKDTVNEESFRRASASAAIAAKKAACSHVAFLVPKIDGLADSRLVRAIAEGALLGTYRFLRFKTREEEIQPERIIRTITILANDEPENREAVEIATAHCDATYYARNLVNEPANYLNPETLADVARKIADESSLDCRVLEAPELKKLGAGAILGVGSGSKIPPRLIQLTYNSRKKGAKKIALVGKGITFDSGGLSLKPAKYMETMKCDMAGAAAVLCTMRMLKHFKPPVDVIGILCAAENMPSGSAIRPGDVLTAMNGKTIEIINTDAEGRLVLADGLSWAEKQKPDEIIDLATLTGACIVGLGPYVAGVMGNDSDLIQRIVDAGQSVGESYWELPIPDEYDFMIKSDIADIKNLAPNSDAGAIQGALFLREFVGDIKWAHLDIAGPAWFEKDFFYIPKNGSGFGVRTLLQYLTDHKA